MKGRSAHTKKVVTIMLYSLPFCITSWRFRLVFTALSIFGSSQALALEYGPWVYASAQCDSRVSFSVAHEPPFLWGDQVRDSTYSDGSSSWALKLRNASAEERQVCWQLLDIPADPEARPNRCRTLAAGETYKPLGASHRLESGPNDTILIRYNGFCEGDMTAEASATSASVSDYGQAPSPSEDSSDYTLPPRPEDDVAHPCASAPISFSGLSLITGSHVEAPEEDRYRMVLKEGIEVGSALANASASHPEDCSISYSLSEHSASRYFSITPEGELALKKEPVWASFDSNQGFYRMDLFFAIVADNGHTRSVQQVLVKLEGDPKIRADSASFSINANEKLDEVVGSLSVDYLDTGTVSTWLEGDEAGSFSLAESGEIRTAGEGFRDRTGESLELQAWFDDGVVAASADVTVRIQPNSAPVMSSLKVVSPLHQVAFVGRGVGRMSASDDDSLSSDLRFQLAATASSHIQNLFEVSEYEGLVKVKDADLLQQEGPGEYIIPVTVTDGFEDDTALMTLELTPNQAPVFSLSDLEISTYPAGESRNLTRLLATDADGDEINYSLASGNDDGYFEYSSHFNTLRVNGEQPLGDYNLVLAASDGIDTVEASIRVSVQGAEPPISKGSTEFFIDATKISPTVAWGEIMAYEPSGAELTHELRSQGYATLGVDGRFRLENMEPDEYRFYGENDFGGFSDKRRQTWGTDGLARFEVTSSNGSSALVEEYSLKPAMPWSSSNGTVRPNYSQKNWGGANEGPGFNVGQVVLPRRLDCEQHIEEFYNVTDDYAFKDSLIRQCSTNTGEVNRQMEAYIDPDYGDGWRFQLGRIRRTDPVEIGLASRGDALVEEGEQYSIRVLVDDPLRRYEPIPDHLEGKERDEFRMLEISASITLDYLRFPRAIERSRAPDPIAPTEGSEFLPAASIDLEVSGAGIRANGRMPDGSAPQPLFAQYEFGATPDMKDALSVYTSLSEETAALTIGTEHFTPGFSYYWRARTVDEQYVGSEWSTVRSFEVVNVEEDSETDGEYVDSGGEDSDGGVSSGGDADGSSSGSGGGGSTSPYGLLSLLVLAWARKCLHHSGMRALSQSGP